MIDTLKIIDAAIDSINENIAMRFEIQDQHIAETLNELTQRVKYLENQLEKSK